MKRLHLIALILGVVAWVACHNLWVLYGTSTYYFGTAFIISISAFIINDIHRNLTTRIFLFMAINNLLDELFFDPSKFSFNEYALFTIFVTYQIIKKWSGAKRL